MNNELTIHNIAWGTNDPQNGNAHGLIMFDNCNAVWFSGNGARGFSYEAYAAYSEAIFGYAPYEEGQLSNWPIPEIYKAARGGISAMLGESGETQTLINFMNWVATFEKRIEMNSMEALAQNVLGRNENFHSVTQFGLRPVDITTGTLLTAPTHGFPHGSPN